MQSVSGKTIGVESKGNEEKVEIKIDTRVKQCLSNVRENKTTG